MLEILRENVCLQHFMKLQSAANSTCSVMGYICSPEPMENPISA